MNGLKSILFMTPGFLKDCWQQGCGAFVKMMTLPWLRNSSFHKHGAGSSSGALGFHECIAQLSFSKHGSGSGFCSFLYIHVFNCLGVPQVEWEMKYIKYTKLKEYRKLIWVGWLTVIFTIFTNSYNEKISEKITTTGSVASENSY